MKFERNLALDAGRPHIRGRMLEVQVDRRHPERQRGRASDAAWVVRNAVAGADLRLERRITAQEHRVADVTRVWKMPPLTFAIVFSLSLYRMPSRGSNTFLCVLAKPRGAPSKSARTAGSLSGRSAAVLSKPSPGSTMPL